MSGRTAPRLRLTRAQGVYAAAVAALAVAACISCFWRLGTSFVLNDEPLYAHAGWIYVHAHHTLSFTGRNNLEHPPLAKYLFGFAQLIAGHRSIVAARMVAAVCTLLAAVVLVVWIGRIAGRWSGLLAGAFYVLIPMPGLVSDNFGRHAMLEPVTCLFATAALACAWQYLVVAHRARASWPWALATGVLTGCATGAKESGFLAVVGPVLLGLAVAVRRSRPGASVRSLLLPLAQTVAATALAVGVFLALYLPLGSPFTIIRYMFKLQHGQGVCGHPVYVAGHTYAFPPWWANFWLLEDSLGPTSTALLVVGVVAALVFAYRRLSTWWLLAALAAPVIFNCFVYGLALAQYWVLWAPQLYALAACGWCAAITRLITLSGRARRPVGDAWARVRPDRLVLVGVAVLALVLVGSIARWVVVAARVSPQGTAVLGRLTDDGRRGTVLLVDVSLASARTYVPTRDLALSLPPDPSSVRYVVIARHQRPTTAGSTGAVAAAFAGLNVSRRTVRRIYSDRYLSVYERDRAYVFPTAAEISAAGGDTGYRCGPEGPDAT